jgi:hypothetical protein
VHYLLFYEVGEDYVSKRAQFRQLHLKQAWEAIERGELILGGISKTARRRRVAVHRRIFGGRPRGLRVRIPTS